MKRTMADADPRIRHKQAMADARTHLEEITRAMAEITGTGPIDWAHVGDANRLRNDLKAIADRLLGRGEYGG